MVVLAGPIAAALVDWGGLVQVVLFAVVAGLVIVGAFSLGVVGLDRWRTSRSGGTAAGGQAAGSISDAASPVGVSPPMVAFGSLAMAIAGFGICLVAVLLGLWSIVHR
jgi:hypothetical protein